MPKQPSPFHESIVEHLRYFAGSSDATTVLGGLIESTIIPANHDQIFQVWRDASLKSIPHLSVLRGRVLAHISQQKAEAEEKARQHIEEIADDARGDCN